MKDSGLGDIIFNAINMYSNTVFADDESYAISNTITQEIKNPMAPFQILMVKEIPIHYLVKLSSI